MPADELVVGVERAHGPGGMTRRDLIAALLALSGTAATAGSLPIGVTQQSSGVVSAEHHERCVVEQRSDCAFIVTTPHDGKVFVYLQDDGGVMLQGSRTAAEYVKQRLQMAAAS